MSELKYWVWLSEHIKFKNSPVMALLDNFGSPEAVYFAREDEYRCIPELTPGQCEALTDKNTAETNRILSVCADEGYRIMTIADADYPTRLKNILTPPLVLYIRGNLPVIDDEAAIAIVGTRKCTPYGLKAAERIAYEISKSGGLVVTGLAAGIDTAAARGALRAGGKVVGVVGGGVDVIYPRFNKAIYEDVTSVGAIVSEYAPGSEPIAGHFPERNRIMSGLCVGVTVAEAPAKSGALITASNALEQGRDVFVVPGNIDAPSCAGSNALLKEGAVPITCGKDVIENYIALFPHKLSTGVKSSVPLDEDGTERLVRVGMVDAEKPPKPTKKAIDKEREKEYIELPVDREELTADEQNVISAMGKTEIHIDDIIQKSALPAPVVLAALTMLQIKGYVTQTPGKNFISHITLK